MKKLPYIPASQLEETLFEELDPREYPLYKAAFGCLRPSSRKWLCIAMLYYRKFGSMPTEPNLNCFVQDIFLSLCEAFDGLKEADAEREAGTIDGTAKLSWPKRISDWFRIF